ncbi:hypothetical protein [Kitasatospora brasiliensis]|uniref:hypothetical protein n=1 Tax=Kitasatospora brasiliensis TaxID=3058040 RepID=UPI002930D878|nr:hypothetical protein [Kitasatospora sp. K002]
MPTWLLDLLLTVPLVAGEGLAATAWFFRGSWETCQGRRKPTPPPVVARWLVGFLVFLVGTGVGLLRLHLPIAATAQGGLAALVAVLLALGAAELLRHRRSRDRADSP